MDNKTNSTNKKQYIVYKHTSPSNKVYIGVTSKTLLERSGVNGINYKRNRYFYSAIQKYGWDKFKHEILCSNLTKEEASKQERYFVSLYHADNPEHGYNHTSGGEIHFEFNDDIKNLIAEKTRTQWKNPHIRNKMIRRLKESHKGPLSKKQIKANTRRRGTHLSEATKEKMRGKVPWNKGKVGCFSKDTIYKMSLARKGKSPHNKGTHLLEEQKRLISIKTKEGMNKPEIKQKIRDNNKKRIGKVFKNYIFQYTCDEKLLNTYAGEVNASRESGVSKCAIHNCISGKSKTAGGYIWKKVSKENFKNEKTV